MMGIRLSRSCSPSVTNAANESYGTISLPMDMLNFAVASSVIKHTIHGDANITDDVKSIRNLADMNYDIRR